MKNPNIAPDATFTRRRRRLRYALEALLFVFIVVAVHVYQTREIVDGPAPVFEVALLDGTRVSLATLQDRPLLLHFWASWCAVCSVEQASIQGISEDYAVLAVSIDDMPVEELAKWTVAQGISYPVAADPAGVLSRRYGVSGIPASIIIDADDRVRFAEVGYTTEAGLRLRLWWAGRHDNADQIR